MYLKNIIERSRQVEINELYDIGCVNFIELLQGCTDSVDLALACFRIGYMQGHKAAVAERRIKDAEKKTR